MVKGMGKNKKTFSGFARGFKFEPSAERYLRAAINGGSRVGVACSGGADSVFLLFWILSFCGAKNLKNIKVLHFNHKARANAEKDEDTKYCLGSVLNHVLLHQTVIGQEAIKQMEMANDYPDIVIGACGGGSNFAGIAFPFIGEMLRGGRKVDVLGVEPAACPSLTKGKYAYDFGDVAKMTPMMKMYTLGSSFIPPAVHAGGLRYHGMAPQVSNVAKQGLMRARTVQQLDVFRDAVAFARSEGITPAPESSHAISAAMDEARKCKETGESKAILFNLSGHGHLDMSAYMEYFSGNLSNYEYPEQEIAMALSGLPVCGK